MYARGCICSAWGKSCDAAQYLLPGTSSDEVSACVKCGSDTDFKGAVELSGALRSLALTEVTLLRPGLYGQLKARGVTLMSRTPLLVPWHSRLCTLLATVAASEAAMLEGTSNAMRARVEQGMGASVAQRRADSAMWALEGVLWRERMSALRRGYITLEDVAAGQPAGRPPPFGNVAGVFSVWDRCATLPPAIDCAHAVLYCGRDFISAGRRADALRVYARYAGTLAIRFGADDEDVIAIRLMLAVGDRAAEEGKKAAARGSDKKKKKKKKKKNNNNNNK